MCCAKIGFIEEFKILRENSAKNVSFLSPYYHLGVRRRCKGIPRSSRGMTEKGMTGNDDEASALLEVSLPHT